MLCSAITRRGLQTCDHNAIVEPGSGVKPRVGGYGRRPTVR